jgi:hypothetical protein
MYLPTYARDTSSQPSLSNEKRFFRKESVLWKT